MKNPGIFQSLGILFLCLSFAACSRLLTTSRDEKILWNGESENSGAGWVSPAPPDLSIETQGAVVHSGSQAVHFHLKPGHNWVEWGWRWFPFWPPAPGTDLRPFRTLSFAIKTSTSFVPDDIKIRLDSAPGLLKSKMISIKAYDPRFSDGQWHVVTIPLADFNVEGMKYDPARADELFFGTQAQKSEFDFYLDDIAVLR